MKPYKAAIAILRKNRQVVLTIMVAVIAFSHVKAQTADWVWVNGSNTTNQNGTYGTKGTAAAANTPGNRIQLANWIDASGNLWAFGGYDFNGNIYNDLWKFNPLTSQWMWVSGSNSTNNQGVYGTKGTAAASNVPGARYGSSGWVDASGNFWVWGGYGVDGSNNQGYLNDLWKFNPTTLQWTWVSGDNTRNSTGVYGTMGTPAAANKPGGRYGQSGWKDAAGNFWLFAGWGNDGAGRTGDLDDLWKYNTATGQWTWVSGDKTRNNTAVYGTKGTAAATNKPGNRDSQVEWTDASGNFWFFGGWDYNGNYYSDLWKYAPGTGLWTWVSGSNTQNNQGVYGTKNTAAAANVPGARYGHNGWVDASGNFWIFGGNGIDGSNNSGVLNDLWMYNPTTGLWTWKWDDNTANTAGVYGTKAIPSTTNKPGGRGYQSAWLDAASNVWVLGGQDVNGNQFNDLWELQSLITLPDVKVRLNGRSENSSNMLEWTTIGEINSFRFEVEKSTDGNSFTTIGEVAAIGSGDNSYAFSDAEPVAGNSYYRIRMMWENGNELYSNVLFLHREAQATISLFPNPAVSYVNLQLPDNSLLNSPLRIFDVAGRLHAEVMLTTQLQTVDVSRLPKGFYIFSLVDGSSYRVLVR
ncbi:kelch repeat-containing protein [Puia dinghuensis]|uniref:Secretion system C-terminal sorting domain-containing protein n=1 Tax=Puia dinghuensis TaxID=1792502 RepID=A0A8J2UJN6_9BACT|nr:kelch repeat-containing protein [Puia dinghuensis]GGB24943.1 hypothetical protein GCM10011511_56110 [Puia dinghuensis]